MRHLERAVALAPEEALYHHTLGRVYRMARRDDEGRAAFERALELDPYHVDTHFSLGMYYLEQGELISARRRMVSVTTLDPDHPQAAKFLRWIDRRLARDPGTR